MCAVTTTFSAESSVAFARCARARIGVCPGRGGGESKGFRDPVPNILLILEMSARERRRTASTFFLPPPEYKREPDSLPPSLSRDEGLHR